MVKYYFKNLVFEGGGVKGIAYASALEVLHEKGILENIKRVAGASAEAITAALVSVGFSPEEIIKILKECDFNKFKDESAFKIVSAVNVIRKYGWFKGDAFQRWFEKTISAKVDPEITFKELSENDERKELYVVGTNLDKKKSEIFCSESCPDMKVSDALRISMSIPLFFQAVRKNSDVYVDGGVYYNFPINLFDNEKYLFDKKKYSPAPYYKSAKAVFSE